LKENGAVLARALDLATDFLNRLHAHENEALSLAIPSGCLAQVACGTPRA
jgi:hypothetical protein